jgi:hypothetical protein
MFTQNDKQTKQTKQQDSSQPAAAAQPAQDSSSTVNQSTVEPPKKEDTQMQNQPQQAVQNDASSQVTNDSTSAQKNYVSSYQPPAQSAQQSQPAQSSANQSLDQGAGATDAVSPDEGFLPSEENNTDKAETDSSQVNNDPINDKLDELELLVKEFEKNPDKVVVQSDDDQEQKEALPPQPPEVEKTKQEAQIEPKTELAADSSDSKPLTTNQLNKDKQMDNPQTDAGNQPANTNQATSATQSETLADQNIFFLLGAEGSSTQEQEQFLDELQQVVWEDFLESDLDLLITSQEKEKADQILQDPNLEEVQKQEQLLEYLDSLIPDLEEIMVDKALQLKKELVLERVASLKESLAQDQAKLQQVNEAEQMIAQGKWQSAGAKLNQLG